MKVRRRIAPAGASLPRVARFAAFYRLRGDG